MKRPALARQKMFVLVVLGLVIITIAVPSAALFFLSSRTAQQRISNLEEAPQQLAAATAVNLAQRIENRLELIRSAESRYTFFEYQDLIRQASANNFIEMRFVLDEQNTNAFLTACRAAWTSAPSTKTSGDFQWFAVNEDRKHRLVAMRESSNAVHGFVLLPTAFDDYLTIPAIPAFLASKNASVHADIRVDLQQVPWSVGFNLQEGLADVQREAKRLRIGFMRFMTAGTIAVGLAGLFVILLMRQMDRLNQQRQRFVASAAHELRTPLTGLQMYSEMLADQLGEPEKIQAYSRHIANEARRLTRIVANILNLTRMERGALNVRPRPGRIDEVIRNSVRLLSPTIETAGANIELHIDENMPEILFDTDALDIIAQNLIDNAEKYSREAQNRTIHVALTSTPHDVLLTVADHGPGISPQYRQKLFKPFTRGDDENAPPGLGLGLATVYMLVTVHGGTIHSKNRPEGGAEFIVSLPRVKK